MFQPTLLIWLALCTLFASCDAQRLYRRGDNASSEVEGDGWVNPIPNGGSMLTEAEGTYPPGLGEPINVIVSAHSDKGVLNQAMIYYFGALGFSENCLGADAPTKQKANLGDGNGYLNETNIMRWNYGDFNFGGCKQTVNGGNHFRYWVQNGPDANTGALFFAVSVEMNLANNHMIVDNGYDFGRDLLTGNATQDGGISFRDYTFVTTVENITGLLEPGSDGVNHGIATDGVVYEYTVKITEHPDNVEDGEVQGEGISSGAAKLYAPLILLGCLALGFAL